MRAPAADPSALPSPGRWATFAFVGWVLAWVTVLGGFTLEAWLSRPLPDGLPSLGGRSTAPVPVALVIIDGLHEESLWGAGCAMPWLARLADEGVGGVAIAGDPTLTAACVRTLLTGRLPDLLTGLKNFTAPPVEGTWIAALRALGARVAHGGDAAVAQMCARSLDPADVLAFSDRGPVDQGQCDALAVPFVLGKVREGVQVISLHLTAPDHAGHLHGATGPEYRAACLRVDEQIRSVLEPFRALHPGATLLVASDHGVSAAGTHGGGERAARRAPFVLVGPGIVRRQGVELSQAALAPTLAAAVGLPQPPLADAPPATELLALPAIQRQRALDAHVQARIWVARRLGGSAAQSAVDPIERRRAELALGRMSADGEQRLKRLSADLDVLARPTSTGSRLLLLGLALLGLLTFVRATPLRGPSVLAHPLWTLGAVLSMGLGLHLAPGLTLSAGLAAVPCALGLTLLAVVSRPRGWERESLLASLVLCLPLLLGGVVAAKDGVERGGGASSWLVPTGLALLGVGALAVWRLAWRSPVRRLAAALRRHPSLAVALAGATLGVALAKRPFVDPFVPLNHVVALAFVGMVWFLVRSQALASVSARLKGALFGVCLALVVVPLWATGGGSTAGWTQSLPTQLTGWAWAGLLATGLALALLPRPWWDPRARWALGLALSAFVLAAAGRWLAPGSVSALPFPLRLSLAFGPQVGALGALVTTLWRTGSREATLAVRLLACLALARRLTASDAEVALLSLVVAAAALLARLPLSERRRSLAFVAIALLLARTAAFHATGGTESRSTVDVGAGFLGLEEFTGAGGPVAEGAGGSAGVTWQMVVAGLQVALRFALPWLVLFAALHYAARRRAALQTLLADLALAFSGRTTALVFCLWALADNVWWVERAQEVVSLGAADLVLLLAAALLMGAFRDERPREGESPGLGQPTQRLAQGAVA